MPVGTISIARANIELYDIWQEVIGWSWKKNGLLYHQWDGYTEAMGPKLEQMLKQAKAELAETGSPFCWDARRVSALIVSLSVEEDRAYSRVPYFQPCLEVHKNISYLWRVFLGPDHGQYDIHCYSVNYDWEKGVIKELNLVDWRKEVSVSTGEGVASTASDAN